MQLVRTSDLILYAKDRIKFYENAIQENKDEYNQEVQKHNKTIWYRWFKITYTDKFDNFMWTHYHYEDKCDNFKELLAKVEYNEKLQQAWIEYDKPGFFNWAKKNNIPF